MEREKTYYLDQDINIHSYIIEKNILVIKLINNHGIFVRKIKLSLYDKEFLQDINSNELVIDLNIDIGIHYSIDKPILVSYFNNEDEEILLNGKKEEYIPSNRPISMNGYAKRLYINELFSKGGIPKDKIQYQAFESQEFWGCICGEINTKDNDKCIYCGESKENIFNNEIDLSKYIALNQSSKIIEGIVFTWSIVVVFLQMFLINFLFSGDLLFSNENNFSFMSVVLRFIVPLLMPILSGSLLFIRSRYYLKEAKIIEYIRDGILILYNLISTIFFIYYSYDFVYILGFNAIFLYAYICKLKREDVKIKSLIMSVCLSLFIVSNVINAFVYHDYDIVVKENGITLNVNGSDKEHYISPEKINFINVDKLVFSSEKEYGKIKEITISKTIERINIISPLILPKLEKINLDKDNKYFYIKDEILYYSNSNKVALAPVTLEKVVIDWEVVEKASFSNMINLKEIVITNRVKEIKDEAFKNCYALKKITFEENSNLEILGSEVFANCYNLETIYLPSSIKSLGDGIYKNCTSIKNVSIPFIGNIQYSKYDYSNKNYFAHLFCPSYDYNNQNLSMPSIDKIEIRNQKIIENAAFYNCDAKEIVINDFDGFLGMNAFYQSSITQIVIPEGVTLIKENCFANCKNLTKVKLPSTLQKIEKNAFNGCSSLIEVDASRVNTSALIIDSVGNETLLNLL